MTLLFLMLFTFFLILLTFIFKRVSQPKPRNLGSNPPPSPWKLPLIGNLHQLVGALPPRALRNLSRRYGPIMHLKLGQVDHIIISSPEAAREIMKTQDLNFASRPQLISPTIVFYGNRDIAFSPYGSYWRQLRKICVLELLSPRRVKSFRPIREQENSALVESILTSSTGKTPVNLSEKLLLYANTTTARAAFGSECKHGPRFITEVKKALELMNGFNMADLFPSVGFVSVLLGVTAKLERIRSQIDGILEEIIKEHLQAEKTSQLEDDEDLVDVLLRLKNEGGPVDFQMDMINIKAVTLDMFTAGTETSSTALAWTMAELMRHPKVMEKTQDEVRRVVKGKRMVEEGDVEEMQYMKLVVKESLRLHPPVPMLLPRVCKETCNVGGFEIRAGSRVIINAWAISRDSKYWGEDAESFKPERFEGSSLDVHGENFQYLPFGGGRRICPGIGFGLANVELTLAQLLFHFDWELPDGKEIDITESLGLSMCMKSDLFLIATPSLELKS